MHEIVDSLAALVAQPEFAHKAMSLLGKLGGRSHSHITAPQGLEVAAHMEQGLRAAVNLSPQTAYWLPLDRIIEFVTEGSFTRARAQAPGNIGAGIENAPATDTPAFRQQAFKLVRTCLSALLNLSAQVDASAAAPVAAPAQAEAPPAAADDAAAGAVDAPRQEAAGAEDAQVGAALQDKDGRRLLAMLLKALPRPAAPGLAPGPGGMPPPMRTKQQNAAEAQCFKVRPERSAHVCRKLARTRACTGTLVQSHAEHATHQCKFWMLHGVELQSSSTQHSRLSTQ